MAPLRKCTTPQEENRSPEQARGWSSVNEVYPVWSSCIQFLATVILIRALRFSLSLSEADAAEMMDALMHVAEDSLPRNQHRFSNILKLLGLPYEKIDCCPGPSCSVQFRGEHIKDLRECPNCGAERFQKGRKPSVRRKEILVYPLIPRLQRLFNTPVRASLMTY